jgi:hypothetical protein
MRRAQCKPPDVFSMRASLLCVACAPARPPHVVVRTRCAPAVSALPRGAGCDDTRAELGAAHMHGIITLNVLRDSLRRESSQRNASQTRATELAVAVASPASERAPERAQAADRALQGATPTPDPPLKQCGVDDKQHHTPADRAGCVSCAVVRLPPLLHTHGAARRQNAFENRALQPPAPVRTHEARDAIAAVP